MIRKSENPEQFNAIIVALTANASQENIDHCLAMGMDDYLAKPFDEMGLKKILSKYERKSNE